MARRLQSGLKQSSIYAVSLANSGRKQPGCTHRPHFRGSMRGTLFSSSEPSKAPARLNVMGIFLQDLHYAGRMLLKNPGFTAVAVLTLALGIGATTAIVSVVKTAVFDPLPVQHPDRLLQFGAVRKREGWWAAINNPALRDVRQQTNLFARVAAYSDNDGLTLQGEEFPQSVPGVWVTSEFFGLLDVRPLLGRTFTADEGQPGKDDVLVISHRLWQRLFGGDPAIIGRMVRFRERPMTVVGVMPPHFSFPTARYDEYWRPVQDPDPTGDDWLANTRVIAEMRPGVEAAQVQAFLDVVSERQAKESQIAAE